MKRSKAAMLFMINSLWECNPHLLVNVDEGFQTGVANLKLALRHEFPDVEFTFKQGDGEESECSFEVTWVDGPMRSEVKGITRLFEIFVSGDTNNQTRKERSVWMRAFGSVGRVYVGRGYSEQAVRDGLRGLERKFGDVMIGMAELPTEALSDRQLHKKVVTIDGTHYSVLQLLSCRLEDTTWVNGAAHHHTV